MLIFSLQAQRLRNITAMKPRRESPLQSGSARNGAPVWVTFPASTRANTSPPGGRRREPFYPDSFLVAPLFTKQWQEMNRPC